MGRRKDEAEAAKAKGKKSKGAKGEEPALVVREGLAFDPADADLSHGLQRFGRQLSAFQKALDSATTFPNTAAASAGYVHRPHIEDESLGHRLYLAGGRTPLFMLEGLARIERGVRSDRDTFDAVLADVKLLEDGLGEVDFWWAFCKQGQAWGLPEPLLQWADDHHAHACGKAEGWLEAHDWVRHRHQPEEGELELRGYALGRKLAREKWPSPSRERKLLAEFLPERLRKMHAAALELDMSDLEGGLHELRRKVRWFSIYAAALEGALTLDLAAPAPAGWDRYLTDAVTKSPFAKLPAPPPGVEPLLVPAPLFYALSWVIAELGDLKDRAQWAETIASGLAATKLEGKPSQWLGDKAIDHHAAGARAKEILAQSIATDSVLLRLAEALEAQR